MEGVVVLMMMIIASSTLMASSTITAAGAWKEGVDQVIHVGGKVLCQDCTQGWKEWVNGAKPINGSRVSITCFDDRSRVVYYGSDETDKAGEFEMTVNKFINGKELKPTGCFLRLVSSPDPVCNIATDFGGGRKGVKLGRPTVVYRDIIKHLLEPFFYTIPMCDEPDTTGPIGKGTKY